MTKRKSIWKFVLAFCCILSAMLVLTACGGDKGKKIDKIETESGIVAIGEFNKGDTLICNPINSQSDEGKAVIEKIKYEDYDKKSDVYIYDIHIKNGDVKVKPNGQVKITMPAPTISAYGFTTFHIMPNDMVEMMSTTYNDGKITFETIDFSYFIVAKNAPRYDFAAKVQGEGGNIWWGNDNKGKLFEYRLKENEDILIEAKADAGYQFDGWYNDNDVLISTESECSFKMGTNGKTVIAKFKELPAELVSLQVNVGKSGLKASGKTLKHKGATEKDLNLDKVVVNGVLSDNSSITLTKDTDYTVDLGGLDLTTIGTYTITFASVANTNIKQTFEIEVKEYVIEYTYLENGYGECLNKEYDGGALFVASNAIIINGKSLREINDVVALGSSADQELLAVCQPLKDKVSYKWVKKGTNTEVQPANDVTMPGKSYAYNRRAVGDELVGPATVGEYEFIFSFEIDGTDVEQFRREGKITERKFKKIMSADEFTTDTGGIGLFASLRYYTIVGMVDGQPYVMQMPKDILETTGLENVEATARLATSDGYEGILLGSSYDTVFTKYYYNSLVKRYYPKTGSDQTQLWEFGTGHYGTRLEKYSANFAYDLFGTGTMKLSGNKIVRSLDVNISGNEGEDTGLMFKFAEDGAVTIYSPYLNNENCALRLVKNTDGTFAFTGKDKTTDTRESYKIYIYSYYVPITERYEFVGDKSQCQKEYDGNAITFNAYKDFRIFNEEISDVGGLLKTGMRGNNGGQYRFAYANSDDGKGGKGGKDEVLVEMTVSPDGTITGPSAVGNYMLYFQKLVTEKDGSTYWQTMGYGPLCTFTIYTISA